MKLVFLDVDGVLNSDVFSELFPEDKILDNGPTPEEAVFVNAMHAQYPQESPLTWLHRVRSIDGEAVKRVNTIVMRSHAKVVISSSWRKLHSFEEMGKLLAYHGLQSDAVIGQTPVVRGPHFSSIVERGFEIKNFLEDYEYRHGEVEKFVILDDDDRMAMLKPFLVRCSPTVGLQDREVVRALQKLGVKPEA